MRGLATVGVTPRHMLGGLAIIVLEDQLPLVRLSAVLINAIIGGQPTILIFGVGDRIALRIDRRPLLSSDSLGNSSGQHRDNTELYDELPATQRVLHIKINSDGKAAKRTRSTQRQTRPPS